MNTTEDTIKCRYPMQSLKDARNRYRTRSLFLEMASQENLIAADGEVGEPLFTMEDYETNGLPSFKRLYVEIGDPTEYRLAMSLLGSVDHWDALKKCAWLQPLLKACRRELNSKLESKALEEIMAMGVTAKESSTKLAAFRTVLKEVQGLDEERQVRSNKRGRPSKTEIDANLKQATDEEKRVLKDYERIGHQTGHDPRKVKEEQREEPDGSAVWVQ